MESIDAHPKNSERKVDLGGSGDCDGISHKRHAVKLPSRPQDKIILALDVRDTDEALQLLDRLEEAPTICKIGMELFTAEGPLVVTGGAWFFWISSSTIFPTLWLRLSAPPRN